MSESTDPKIRRRVLRHLAMARTIASAAGVALTVPASDGALSLESVFAIRRSLALARRAEAKGSQKRSILQGASMCALLADKVLSGAAPLVPDSHRSAVRPTPAAPRVTSSPSSTPPTMGEAIGAAFDSEDDDG